MANLHTFSYSIAFPSCEHCALVWKAHWCTVQPWRAQTDTLSLVWFSVSASVSQALNTQTTHIHKLSVPCSVCWSWLKLQLSCGYSSRALNRLSRRTGMPASDHLVGGKEDKQRRAGHGLRKDEGWTWEERRSSRERWGNELSRRRKMPSAVDSTGLQDTPFLSLLSSVEIKSEKVKFRAWTRE